MWFVRDAFGIFLLACTWSVMAFSDGVVVKHIFLAWFFDANPRLARVPMTDFGAGLCFAYQCLVGVTLLAHFRASTTDPGTVRQAKAPPRFRNPRMCKICSDGWKPPRAHHCKVCQSCIFRMDHHCPWINNCVGLQNQKVFILFLGYTLLTALVTLVLILGSAACWLFGVGSPARPSDSFWGVCMTALVALMCVASLFFVTEFLQEQLEGIQSNSTLVETYQRTHGAQSTFRNHLLGVFGTKWWIWLWPCPSAPPPDYSEPALPNDESGPRSINADSAHAMGIAGEETEYCLGFFSGGVGSSGRLHRGRRSYGRATPGSAGRPSVDSTDRPVDNQFDRTRQSSAGFSGLSGFPLCESGREETGHKADVELARSGQPFRLAESAGRGHEGSVHTFERLERTPIDRARPSVDGTGRVAPNGAHTGRLSVDATSRVLLGRPCFDWQDMSSLDGSRRLGTTIAGKRLRSEEVERPNLDTERLGVRRCIETPLGFRHVLGQVSEPRRAESPDRSSVRLSAVAAEPRSLRDRLSGERGIPSFSDFEFGHRQEFLHTAPSSVDAPAFRQRHIIAERGGVEVQ